jgi:hypothetical protein
LPDGPDSSGSRRKPAERQRESHLRRVARYGLQIINVRLKSGSARADTRRRTLTDSPVQGQVRGSADPELVVLPVVAGLSALRIGDETLASRLRGVYSTHAVGRIEAVIASRATECQPEPLA